MTCCDALKISSLSSLSASARFCATLKRCISKALESAILMEMLQNWFTSITYTWMATTNRVSTTESKRLLLTLGSILNHTIGALLRHRCTVVSMKLISPSQWIRLSPGLPLTTFSVFQFSWLPVWPVAKRTFDVATFACVRKQVNDSAKDVRRIKHRSETPPYL